MPVLKCSNGKYRIGSGKCIYKSKSSADRAYAGYRAKSHMEEFERSAASNLISFLDGDGSDKLPPELEDVADRMSRMMISGNDIEAKELFIKAVNKMKPFSAKTLAMLRNRAWYLAQQGGWQPNETSP